MKRKLRFTLAHRPKDRFLVGQIYRFKWVDVYRALQIAQSEVQDKELKVKLNSLLGTTKEMIHTHLFEVLQALEYDKCANSDTIKCVGWVIACYGYIKGLPTLSEDGSSTAWPHPAPLRKRKQRTQYPNYRDELKCPFCGRNFIPTKRYKTKAVVLRWFGRQLKNHLIKELH